MDLAPAVAAARAGEIAGQPVAAEPGKSTLAQQPAPHTAAAAASGSAEHAEVGPQLGGTMLVSNNPEGLTTPGIIMQVDVPKGPLAVYVHHSNHTRAAMHMFLVITPVKPTTMTMQGTSAAGSTGQTTGDKALAGGSAQWNHDPNAIVSVANESAGDAGPNGKLVGAAQTLKLATATPIPIGVIPATRGGDPPLFDARYDLVLQGPARIAVVCEAPALAKAAATDKQWATGNTKYQEQGTNGRAAGLYTGAELTQSTAVQVSQLEQAPKRLQLTGNSSSPISPQAVDGGRQQAQAPDAQLLASVSKQAAAGNIDQAMVLVLQRVFRIAPDWLRERKWLVGDKLNVPENDDSVRDYRDLVDDLRVAVTASAKDPKALAAFCSTRPTIGANADAASYGTRFDLHFAIHNDTRKSAAIDATFRISDGKAGTTWLGGVKVDGVMHGVEIDSATAGGEHKPLPPAIDLGKVATVPVGATHDLHVELMSPGQASGGQSIEVTAK